jgi:general L-amino acid transport system permease protein
LGEFGSDVNTHNNIEVSVPLWRNVVVLKWLAQVAVLLAVVGLFGALGSQAARNWTASGITFGWEWLAGPFGVALSEGIDTLPDSGARALVVGAINTLRVAFAAIVASTLLGTLVGVARLSGNWIAFRIATVFVETVRNIPLLLQIFFWQALTFALPALTESDIGTYWIKITNRGFGISWIRWNGGFWPWLVFLAAGVFVGRWVAQRLRRRQAVSGQSTHPIAVWFLVFSMFGVVGWFTWPMLSFVSPVLYRFSDLILALPSLVAPVALGFVAIAISARWIWRFFRSRRGPGGFSKLTDDDWFRAGFVGFAGFAVAGGLLVVGSAEVLTTSGETMTVAELGQRGLSSVVRWMGNNFSPEGNQPLVPQRVSVVKSGNFARFGDTGLVMTIPFFTVWIAITTYTAAFIAEIVRGAIQAVPKGQVDAAKAVGLARGQYLRTIILPQALRIILPPLGNQYINALKNSSLGVATALPDIMNVGITIVNQTGQFRAVVAIWIAFFLGISLAMSGVVNYYNHKMNLVGT